MFWPTLRCGNSASDWNTMQVGRLFAGTRSMRRSRSQIAPEVGSMKVFVRTPQYVIPMRNPKYSGADWEKWGSRFHELKARVRSTFAGFDYDFDAGPWAEKTPEERKKEREQRLPDLGSPDDFMLQQAVHQLKGEPVQRTKSRLEANAGPMPNDASKPSAAGARNDAKPAAAAPAKPSFRPMHGPAPAIVRGRPTRSVPPVQFAPSGNP